MSTSVLRHALLEGQIPPGSRLLELELSRTLKIGRTPIREALFRLAADGLIESLPGAKFTVKHHTLEDMEESYRIRASLECLALRLAFERGFPNTRLDEMDRCCDLMEEAAEAENGHAVSRADLEFHRILVGLARSPRLEMAIRNSQLQMFGSFLRFEKAAQQTADRREVKRHRDLVRLLRARNTEAAVRLLERHLSNGFEEIRRECLKARDSQTLARSAAFTEDLLQPVEPLAGSYLGTHTRSKRKEGKQL